MNIALVEGQAFEREFVVEPRVYEGFLAAFDDTNPLHVDDAYASGRGFRERVMHGNILGGFLSYFVGRGLPLENVVIHRQELRFAAPVYLHDRLAFKATLVNVSEAVGVLEFKFTFHNQDGRKIASGAVQVGLLGGSE